MIQTAHNTLWLGDRFYCRSECAAFRQIEEVSTRLPDVACILGLERADVFQALSILTIKNAKAVQQLKVVELQLVLQFEKSRPLVQSSNLATQLYVA